MKEYLLFLLYFVAGPLRRWVAFEVAAYRGLIQHVEALTSLLLLDLCYLSVFSDYLLAIGRVERLR